MDPIKITQATSSTNIDPTWDSMIEDATTGTYEGTRSLGGDPIVEEALFGGPLNKGTTAALVGMGYELSDPWVGIGQMLGVVNEREQNRKETMIDNLRADSLYGRDAWVGSGIGMLVEPAGLLIPGGKFKTAAGAFGYASIVGGAYGAATYADPQENRIHNAAIGAAILGPVGLALHGARRYFRETAGPHIEDRMTEATDEILALPHLDAEGKRIIYSKNLGRAISKSPTKTSGPGAMTKAERELENVEQLEARVATRGPRNETLGKIKTAVDDFFQPLYNNIKKYSEPLSRAVRKVDFETHDMQRKWLEAIEPLQKKLDSVPQDMQAALHKVLLNEGVSAKALKMAREIGGTELETSLKVGKNVLDEILGEYQKMGYHIKARPDYFPRTVSNLEGLIKEHGSIIDDAVKSAAAKKKSGKLTAKEQEQIIQRLLTFDPRYSATSGSLKSRVIQEIGDEQAKYYHDPISSLYYYVNTAAEDLANRRFFKSWGYKPGKTGLDVSGGDLDKSIDSVIESLSRKNKNLTWKEKNEIVNMLRKRFSTDVHRTSSFIKGLKNLSYASTLGNYASAITQIGDVVFAFHKYGIADTVHALFSKRIMTKADLGINKAMQELNEAGRGITAKVADWAFKYGGFDAVDSWGKSVNINASIRANRRLAIKNPDKFRKKWASTFMKGPTKQADGTYSASELEQVLREFQGIKLGQKGNLSANVKLAIWNDLADTQPIGLSEMPLKYLQHPDGRVFYAYKTFTLKQINYMRETLMRGDGNPAKRAANLMYFATLFVMANASIDQFKDFIGGKDLDFEDKVLDNIVGLFGTNKYAVDKSRGLGSLMLEGFKPVPITQTADVLDWGSKAFGGDVDIPKALSKTPVFGKPGAAINEWATKP